MWLCRTGLVAVPHCLWLGLDVGDREDGTGNGFEWGLLWLQIGKSLVISGKK